MNDDEKKALLMNLHKAAGMVQILIESQIGNLIENDNTESVEVILLDMTEISIRLIKSKY